MKSAERPARRRASASKRRPLARVGGELVLLSWSGTAFEYLMPSLWLRDVDDALLVNVVGLEHLLAAAERNGKLRRWVQVGTLGVYAPCHHYGTDETVPPNVAGLDGYTLYDAARFSGRTVEVTAAKALEKVIGVTGIFLSFLVALPAGIGPWVGTLPGP